MAFTVVMKIWKWKTLVDLDSMDLDSKIWVL